MPPGSYSEIFGGSNIYPSQPTYLLLNPLTASVVLDWPIEQSMAGNLVVADIIDVNATAGGLSIQLSNAEEVSTGYTALFNNIGANTFTVLDSNGATLATIASGTVWQIYLSDNTTTAGTWRIFQFGAGASSANAAALAGAGLLAITTTLNQNYAINVQNANYNFQTTDRAKVVEWIGGTGTGTLPVPATVTSGWFTIVKNSGTGIWTLSVSGGENIDGTATLALNPEQSCFLISDGSNFFTLGLGQEINSLFDFIQISLTGQVSPFTLTGAQLNRISYRFVGVLTANMVIVVPSTVQQYWVDNETTGAFTLTIQTANPGTTTQVNQGSRNILYSDGVNVVPAVTFGSTGFPNGSAATPALFFTASPATGLYSPGTDQIAITTAGVERLLIDNTGRLTLGESTGAGPQAVFQGTSTSQVVALMQSPSSNPPATPTLELKSTLAGGTASMSIAGNNGTPNVNDFNISQAGGSLDVTLAQNAAANLIFSVNGQVALECTKFDEWIISAPQAGGAGTSLTINTIANVFGIFLKGVGPAQPLINVTNSVTTGAQTATFAATNKPGTGTTAPSKWLPLQADGVIYYIPCWQ